MKPKLLFLLILCCNWISEAQEGFRTKYFSPNSLNISTNQIFEFSQGNYIGTGFITDTSAGFCRNQIALIGMGNSGNVLWVKKHCGGNIEYVKNSLLPRSFYKKNNSIYYTGSAQNLNGGRRFGVMIKYNSLGDTLWRRVYMGQDSSEELVPQAITKSVNGGLIMTGYILDWNNHVQPGLILETDSNGNELWRKRIDFEWPNVCDCRAIIQDSATKRIVITGQQYVACNPTTYISNDLALITNEFGDQIFRGSYCGITGSQGVDVIQLKDKSFIMLAYTKQYVSPVYFDLPLAIKFSLNNPHSPHWRIKAPILTGSYDRFTSVAEAPNGNLLIGGVVNQYTDSTYDASLLSNLLTRYLMVTKEGSITDVKYYDYHVTGTYTNNHYWPTSVNVTRDGGWITAFNSNNPTIANPFFFVKYNPAGCDSVGQYCDLLASNEENSDLLDFQMYPNPTQNYLKIKCNKVVSGQSVLSIYTINGELIHNEIFQEIIEKEIDFSFIKAGVYFITLTSKNKIFQTKKLVIAR